MPRLHRTSRLIIDVTDTLSSWSGAPTGIQRVLLNLAKASTGYPRDRVVIGFLNEWGNMSQLQPETFIDIFDPVKRKKASIKIKRGVVAPTVCAACLKKVSAHEKQAKRVFPAILKKIALSMCPHGLVRFYTRQMLALPSQENTGPRSKQLTDSTLQTLELNQHDVLFIADSNWNLRNYCGRVQLLKAKCGIKVIGFVHDIIPIMEPHLVDEIVTMQFEQWLRKLTLVSEKILTNSAYTTAELNKWLLGNAYFSKLSFPITFGNCDGKIDESAESEVLSTLDPRCSNNGGECSDLGRIRHWTKREPFILWVGTIDLRKNLEQLLLAIIKLARDGFECPRVAVVGRPSRGAENIHRWLRHTALEHRVTWFEGIRDEELQVLYSKASLFICTSWTEGYGLPVEEALMQGVPCLVANSGALPEAGGSCVEYFDPFSVPELANKIRKYFSDADFQHCLHEKAKQIVRKPWSNALEEILAATEDCSSTI